MHLCSQLISEHGDLEDTSDGDKSIALHSEVRWYGDDGSIKYRSDIVLIDTGSLEVLDKPGLRLPSKGYAFNKAKCIIELKLRRPNGKSNSSFNKLIDGDFEKLKELKLYFKMILQVFGL
jgi:hypothetical protein